MNKSDFRWEQKNYYGNKMNCIDYKCSNRQAHSQPVIAHYCETSTSYETRTNKHWFVGTRVKWLCQDCYEQLEN